MQRVVSTDRSPPQHCSSLGLQPVQSLSSCSLLSRSPSSRLKLLRLPVS